MPGHQELPTANSWSQREDSTRPGRGPQGALVAGEKGLKDQPVPTFPSNMGVNRNPKVFTNVSEVIGSARTRAGALASGPT